MVVEVKAIEGKCPIYQIGDKLIIDAQKIPLDKAKIFSGTMCIHAVAGLYGAIMMVRHGPAGRKLVNQCLDPGPPYVKEGGRVIFEIRSERKLKRGLKGAVKK